LSLSATSGINLINTPTFGVVVLPRGYRQQAWSAPDLRIEICSAQSTQLRDN
jgi:hypothetical protein